MPPSQLKRLKASLRAEGVTGPQQSKRQKRKNHANGTASEQRAQRGSALHRIREQFNPFEVKEPSRGEKFEVTRSGQNGGKAAKGPKGRPGVTKGLGEEVRRRTLLKDIESRNKVGGIRDRRFGEDDPTMTPEERMLERYTREKQRRMKNDSLFNLDDDEQQGQLTHMGQSLSFDGPSAVDDFNEGDLAASDEDDIGAMDGFSRKRRRLSDEEDSEGGSSADKLGGEPDRKKSKAEVMKEVMAKSKLHKYMRQQAKDEDEDFREELDKELPGLLAMLRTGKSRDQNQSRAVLEAKMNPERAALMAAGPIKSNTDYDKRLREMAMDKRSMPTERTKTEQEKAEEEAARLRELEESRLRRMRGEEESEPDETDIAATHDDDQVIDGDEAHDFGLGTGISAKTEQDAANLDEEDDFMIDEDLVASASDTASSESDEISDGEDSVSEDENSNSDEEDDDFVQGLLSADEKGKPEFDVAAASKLSDGARRDLAFTYPCPQSHAEFLRILDGVPVSGVQTVVQRIRALYHPKLNADNKEKLGTFSRVVVDHLEYLANSAPHPPFAVLETLTRHIHSLAKTYPEDVSNAVRAHLKDFQDQRPLAPTAGDLVVLAAVGAIFPTSDHFHQVATPANVCLARYLSQKLPESLADLSTGCWIQTICLQYQRLSKRYVPEVLNYTLNALSNLAPVKPDLSRECFPYHEVASSLRIKKGSKVTTRQLQLWDTDPQNAIGAEEDNRMACATLETQLALTSSMTALWADKPAFVEAFGPVLRLVRLLDSEICRPKLSASTRDMVSATAESLKLQLQQAHLSRRPLALHNHRPLPIKTSIPKFEDSFDPTKHYDPNRDRAELSKLKAEHKRERKGAMRELRKDANFIARESLREKKERDQEYEKKYKRLVAEIQGEEGREANQYEREKRMRKGKK